MRRIDGLVVAPLLTALAVAAVAALIGHLAATVLGLPTTGWAIAGALLGLALVAARDALRAGHLMAWLRGAQSADAPRDTGFWGELGYRIERALRSREQELQRERQRIAQFLSAIEASPNGVMLLDARRPDRVVQLALRPITSASTRAATSASR